MVGTIVAAVRGERHDLIALHGLGLLLGACLWLLPLALLGQIVTPTPTFSALALAAVALTWAALVLSGARVSVWSSRRQVPLSWRYDMRPREYAFAYGVGLGIGPLTQNQSLALYLAAAACFFFHDPVLALIVAGTYAAVRLAPLILARRAKDPQRSLAYQGRLDASFGRARRAEALLCAAGGLLLVAAVSV